TVGALRRRDLRVELVTRADPPGGGDERRQHHAGSHQPRPQEPLHAVSLDEEARDRDALSYRPFVESLLRSTRRCGSWSSSPCLKFLMPSPRPRPSAAMRPAPNSSTSTATMMTICAGPS